MRLFTFIVEKGGGTYISQHSARNLKQAVVKFCAYAEFATIVPLDGHECLRLMSDDDLPVPLDGLTGAWCTSSLDKDEVESALINIVLTDDRSMEGPEE